MAVASDRLPRSTESGKHSSCCAIKSREEGQAFPLQHVPYARPPCPPAVLNMRIILASAGGQAQPRVVQCQCGAGRIEGAQKIEKGRAHIRIHTQRDHDQDARCVFFFRGQRTHFRQAHQHGAEVRLSLCSSRILRLLYWPRFAMRPPWLVCCKEGKFVGPGPHAFQHFFYTTHPPPPPRKSRAPLSTMTRVVVKGRPIRVCCATHPHAPR